MSAASSQAQHRILPSAITQKHIKWQKCGHPISYPVWLLTLCVYKYCSEVTLYSNSWQDSETQELTHTHTHTLYEFVCLHVYIFMTSLLYVQCHRLWMRFAKNWRKRRKFPKMPQPSTLCLPKSNCVPKRQACGSSPRHCCGGSSLITHHNILLKDSLSTCVKNILWHLGFLVWLAFFCMTHLLHT